MRCRQSVRCALVIARDKEMKAEANHRRGKPWSSGEDASLMRHVLDPSITPEKPRPTLADLCAKHGRTSTALLYRIKKNLQNEFPNITSASDLTVIQQKHPRVSTDIAVRALETAISEKTPSDTTTTTQNGNAHALLCRMVSSLQSRLERLEARLARLEELLKSKKRSA